MDKYAIPDLFGLLLIILIIDEMTTLSVLLFRLIFLFLSM